MYDIKSDFKFSIYYIVHFILFSLKQMFILTGVYGHVGHHILHEEEKYRRINTSLEYDPKEDELLLHCPLYVNYLEDYTKIPWPRRLSTESVTEDHMWGFLFYQAHWAKRKQGGRLKSYET